MQSFNSEADRMGQMKDSSSLAPYSRQELIMDIWECEYGIQVVTSTE